MTLFLIVVHTRLLLHASPLWRDEVNSVYVATTPSLKEFLNSLVLDPFPILFVTVLRIWVGLGFGSSDFGLRVLGFLIGTSLLGAIWVSCRMIDKEWCAPLWPLALFAFSPSTLIEGDSLRAYGLGLIGIVMSFGLVWRLTFRRWRLGTAIAAVIAGLLAVQSLYLNSLILFAICFAGILVSLRRKQWWPAVAILSVGLIAALSLLPYARIMLSAYEHLALQSEPKTISGEMPSLISSHLFSRPSVMFVCVLLFSCGLITVSVPRLRQSLFASIKVGGDPLLFALIVVLVGAIMTFGLLLGPGLHSSRYRRPFMAATSLSIHVAYTTRRKSIGLTIANLIGSGLTVAAFVPSSYYLPELRRTNCDLAAGVVAKSAGQDDLVIVTRFTHAPTFQRYYHGMAAWTSVPAVGDHLQHRGYLARAEMMNPDAIQNTLLRIESELKARHKVFLVGRFPLSAMHQFPPAGIAPQNRNLWRPDDYLNLWHSQIVNLLSQHAVRAAKIALNETQQVDAREKEEVFVFSGWKD
jgi:hypothetical protein